MSTSRGRVDGTRRSRTRRPSRPVRTATIRGQRWRLLRPTFLGGTATTTTLGDCQHATRTLRVRAGLRGLLALDVWCHEIIHAAFPDLDEEAVNEIASDLAMILWRLGYRLEGE